MSDKFSKIIMIGILVCLVIIAFKPVPSFNCSEPTSASVNISNETIFQIGENKIGIVKTNPNSGVNGEIFVLEFNETNKEFDLVGRYNYADFFNNPQKYNL